MCFKRFDRTTREPTSLQETLPERSTRMTACLRTRRSNLEMCAGRDKYQRNLKLLVPFLEDPKLTLFDIQEEDLKLGQERSITAKWNLRTYIRLPWKPLIDVDGSTLYVMDANSKIVQHIESWSISGGKAVQQLFVASDRAFFRKQSNF